MRRRGLRTFGLWTGLVVGAAAQPLGLWAAPAPGGEERVVAQLTGRASRGRAALNAAWDCWRRGDYDAAAAACQEADRRQDDLSPQERGDLARLRADVDFALKARHEGGELVQRAEQALHAGRAPEATELLKRVAANEQYLAPPDRLRFQKLNGQLKPGPVPTARPDAAGSKPMAQAKVQQARQQLAQGNFEVAEALAHDAERMGVPFIPSEDSPKKVLDDLAKARTDPKALLLAARAALARKDYERAESYARLSEKASSVWTFPVWADNPSKVLKEVQAGRAQAAKPAPQGPAAPPAVQGTGKANDPRANLFAVNQKPAQPDAAARPKAAPPAAPVAAMEANLETARNLLRQGKKALEASDLAQAHKLSAQARDLKANLGWWEDTPDKLDALIARAEAARGGHPGAPAAPAQTAAAPRDDPHALVKEGRARLAEGNYDAANACMLRAKAAVGAKWGLFDDTPDQLQKDIIKARGKHDQEESVKVLVEARRLFAAHDYEGATRASYRAQTLHGPYGMFDLGDRPSKVLADIQAARERERKTKIELPAALAVNKDNKASKDQVAKDPAAPPGKAPAAPGAEDRARGLLAQARLALRNNDLARARLLADQARDTGVVFNRPGEDSAEAVYRDIAQAAQAAPAVTRTATNTPPRNKARAAQLVAEARQMLQQGRLFEARQKAVEAQALGVPFGPDEEGPDVVAQHAAFAARQRIDGLMHHASELAARGAGDPAPRYQQADKELQEARGLVVAFGLDLKPIDGRIDWLRQLRGCPAGGGIQTAANFPAANQGPTGVPAVFSPDGPGGPVSMAQRGQELLNKARLELRNGETNTARRLAEDAAQGPYGVQKEAFEVLRSVDVEEFNQRQLQAVRTFDAAMAAVRRHDFEHASVMLGAIDPRLLDEGRQNRLKEVMMTAEMHPAARQVALAGGQEAQQAPPAGRGSGSPGELVSPPPGAGRARATDNPEESVLMRTQAMRQVKFQQLRADGLSKQKQAQELFRTGQTDAALELLHDYVAHIDDEQLDPGQLALLRRPVESRIQQFGLLKAQKEFTDRTTASRRMVAADRGKEALAQENKQKNVDKLMKEFNALFHEGKYVEAEALAMRAKELDPDNGVVTAAVYMARRQRNVTEYNDIKERKEAMVLGGLNDAEQQGPARAIKDIMVFDKDRSNIAQGRKSPSGIISLRKNEKELEIERKLNTPVSLNFVDQPLRQVINDIRDWNGINIYIDEPALLQEGVSLDRPISIKLDQVSLKSALNMVLHNVHLTHVIQDEVLRITTEAQARGKLMPVVYQVADLIIPVENFGDVRVNAPTPPFAVDTTHQVMGPPTPVTGNFSLPSGTPTGTPTGGSMSQGGPNSPFASSSGGQAGWSESGRQSARNTLEESLIQLITHTVAPQSWSDMGGPGTIDYNPMTMALVINQTPDIQDQVADLLAALRRLQDQEVSVEVRFISVAEDFFERIGVNFNLNIINRSTTRFQPQITTGQFTPDSFINGFFPSNFGPVGLTAANTITPDLNIPILNNTFAQAIPPFGGYTGLPGYGGLTMGLAFLSDIQVFLFMEAVQGDRRTNVMQAPKLTLFNGQTSRITATDSQFFITGVQVQTALGQFLYTPQSMFFNFGSTITIQAVISADRRFVRLSLTPNLTNLATPLVELFPVVTPIFPQFDGTFTGQPVVFTQFLQRPIIQNVNINTTVAVPDGGTVLLGGLKRLSEGRNEFGPPILSKIPFIDRLYKNVGYGREAESLLIMVTPRIIINEEEELRQTGYSPPPPVPAP
jgi:type II secretory pathway component GspD/PulD (secretin)